MKNKQNQPIYGAFHAKENDLLFLYLTSLSRFLVGKKQAHFPPELMPEYVMKNFMFHKKDLTFFYSSLCQKVLEENEFMLLNNFKH